jgi:hypothetical protein
VYSERIWLPPLACQSLTSWSKSDIGRRPAMMSVIPSVNAWLMLSPLADCVAE